MQLSMMLVSAMMVVSSSATTMRIDYLPLAHVRTDPIVNSTCLSGHIHTYYGPDVPLRPELTYNNMRSANTSRNSGNVRENLSLYWHPSIYMYDRVNQLYHLVTDIHTSVYYNWEQGPGTTAFPDGLKMIVQGSNPKASPLAECVEASSCQRGSQNCQQGSAFFPTTRCDELEMSITFPSCWDGQNLDSDDHMSHVAFTTGAEGLFESPCPNSHPYKIPQIEFFFRIYNYQGGDYRFSDGADTPHADYFGGWDRSFLQEVLDNCVNPDTEGESFCEDQVTFRDGDKNQIDSAQGWINNLLAIQPDPPNDPKATVTNEDVTGVSLLPSGECSGDLIQLGPPTPPPPPTNPPTSPSTPPSAPTPPPTLPPTPPPSAPTPPTAAPPESACPDGFVESDEKPTWPRVFNEAVDSVDDCAMECEDIEDCTGFTFKKSTSKCVVFTGDDSVECGTTRLCCVPSDDQGCPEGFHFSNRRPNGPIVYRGLEDSFSDCADHCDEDEGCTGFRFHHHDNRCRVYSGEDERSCGGNWDCCVVD